MRALLHAIQCKRSSTLVAEAASRFDFNRMYVCNATATAGSHLSSEVTFSHGRPVYYALSLPLSPPPREGRTLSREMGAVEVSLSTASRLLKRELYLFEE